MTHQNFKGVIDIGEHTLRTYAQDGFCYPVFFNAFMYAIIQVK
jgi:hypothetical protein